MMRSDPSSLTVKKIAQLWLKEFDQLNLVLCWQLASPELKKQIDEADFTAIMLEKISHRGAVNARDLIDAGTEMTYFKKPELVHRVLRFEASLNSGRKSQELVTLVKGDDGAWQVANYTVL